MKWAILYTAALAVAAAVTLRVVLTPIPDFSRPPVQVPVTTSATATGTSTATAPR